MQTLQSYIRKSDAFKAFAANRKSNIKAEGLDGFPLFQCARLMAEGVDGNTWVICPTDERAKSLYSDSSMSSGLPVMLLPASGRVLYSQWEGTAREYEQIRVLGNIGLSEKAVIITSIRAFCSPVPAKSAVVSSSITIKAGQSLDTMEVAERLGQGKPGQGQAVRRMPRAEQAAQHHARLRKAFRPEQQPGKDHQAHAGDAPRQRKPLPGTVP